jgi:hypothetical protein
MIEDAKETNDVVCTAYRMGCEQTREVYQKRIEKLEAALRRCDELFSDIRNDWSDPRSECREGWSVIKKALEGKDE